MPTDGVTEFQIIREGFLISEEITVLQIWTVVPARNRLEVLEEISGDRQHRIRCCLGAFYFHIALQ